MVFKVFYQKMPDEIPVRERTETLYVDAESESEVRHKLAGKYTNIEYIQGLDEAHLAYEKKSDHFKLENL
ncbi:RNA polymerase subunit omega 1 [Barrientosiimonas marina]|uniref:DNA-directed RNA polymerase subunit epsilon n=1 Tax=Lentibacillus kimchii TaxID=1542911 RepID=A0ABW2UP33_9BACI